MSGKQQRLRRLLALRRLREDIDRRRLRDAIAAVAEVDAALLQQQQAAASATQASQRALLSGNRHEWLLAEAQSEAAGWNRSRLAPLLDARAAEIPPTMSSFLQSRREYEQIKHLVESDQASARLDEDRRAQAVADDWFLGRRLRS